MLLRKFQKPAVVALIVANSPVIVPIRKYRSLRLVAVQVVNSELGMWQAEFQVKLHGV